MAKKAMYYDVNSTKIHRDHYKAGTGILRLLKSVWTVIMIGESPISHSSTRRRIHSSLTGLTEQVFHIGLCEGFYESFIIRDKIFRKHPFLFL